MWNTVMRRGGVALVVMTAAVLIMVAPSSSAGAAVTTPTPSPVSVGTGFVCATVASSADDCLGVDTEYELGYFYGNTSATPFSANGVSDAIATSAGFNSACALLAGGGVDCWGLGSYGELGDGSTPGYSPPVPVTGISTATSVSVGYFEACATLADGSVECWGQNGSGQLGNDESSGTEDTPQLVTGIDTAVQVSVGDNFACALLSSGSVECWGDDSNDELGSNATGSGYEPVAIASLSDVTDVSAGVDGACAIAAGTVYCWGADNDGDLGDGVSGTPSATPLPVEVSGDAVSLSAGNYFACASYSTGESYCWGSNANDVLGDGLTNSYSPLPQLVELPEPASAISAGSIDACAVEAGTNSVYCWGSNNWDQLGSGGGGESDTPVQINGLDAVIPQVSYTVTLNPEGGTIGSTSLSYNVGGSPLTLPTPTLAGYTFDGWYSAPTGGSLESSPYTPGSSITLYAQWSPDQYTVTLDANGGNVSEQSLSFTVGDPGLTLPIPARTGYSFLGWTTSPSDGSATDSPYTPGSSITLYAQWKRVILEVVLNPQGGSVATTSLSYNVGGSPLTLPTPTLAGYTFDGWYSASTGGSLESSPYTPSSSMTLYAQWTPDQYTVSYDARGGHASVTSSSFTVGTPGITLASVARPGYTFDGWYSAATGGALESSPYVPTANTTLYARWTLDAPARPMGLVMTRRGRVVTVRWTAVANATRYVCTLISGDSPAIQIRATVSTNHCSFTVSSSTTAYRASVVSINGAGTSTAAIASLTR